MITAEVVITGCRCRCIDGLSSGFVRAKRTVESALDQTLRAQSRGITGTQFRSALRAVWHLDQSRSSLFYAFRPRRCNLQPAIPYSWQVSRIETGHLIDQDKRRFVMKRVLIRCQVAWLLAVPMFYASSAVAQEQSGKVKECSNGTLRAASDSPA